MVSRSLSASRYGRPTTARLAGPPPWSVQATSRRADRRRTTSRRRWRGGDRREGAAVVDGRGGRASRRSGVLCPGHAAPSALPASNRGWLPRRAPGRQRRPAGRPLVPAGRRSFRPASLLPRRRPTRAVAGLDLDLDPVSGRARLSYRRAAELFQARTGWTLHQLRHSALTHAAEDGTNLPLLLARSRHASVRSLERYARPGPEAVARHLAQTDPARRRP
jgi:hypothetical protein